MRRFIPLFALLAAALIPRAPAAAQGGGPVPVLFEPLDWGPNAAWRRRAAEVRTVRNQLLQQGDLRTLNAVRGGVSRFPFLIGALPTTALTGAFHAPVIVIGYKDMAVQNSTSAFQCLLFNRDPASCGNPGDRPYSVTSFYEEMSQHRITLDGVVYPSVRVDSSAAYYTDGCYGIGVNGKTCAHLTYTRMAQMLLAALDSINNRPDGNTLWAQFDNDGPDGVPNSGDDDGVVDFVAFLQPEVGGECVRNTPPSTGIWSHRFGIRYVSAGSGNPHLDALGRFVTRTPSASGRAGPFIVVDDYTIQSQLGGATACDGTSIMGIGTIAHETGHAFGLPDLYDTSGLTQGIGGWGLMGSGNYARPYSPSSYDAWSLNALGWITVDTLGTSRTINTGPRLLTDTVFYARTANPDEYLLVENRAAVLSDTAQMNPSLAGRCPVLDQNGNSLGFCAKSPGLLLWLIHTPCVRSNSPDMVNNVVNFSGNLCGVQGVELIQADGLNQLRTAGLGNRGDVGDSYPGTSNNSAFSLLATPSARGNNGEFIGFIIDQIQQLSGGRMSFRFIRREPTVIQAQGGALVRVNGVLWSRYEEVVPGGDLLQLAVDDPQALAGGKSRARFIAWSQGGPKDQTVVSNPARPDTLSASFTLEHRLLLTTTGGGTVSATVTGDLSQGVFLAEGAQVVLTATAPTGAVFTGWRGDTVATDPTLNLTMRKGYDLEAHFVTQIAVAGTDAVSELLGTPKLSDAQKTYLDELGNRNGIFDVGDLLALYRRLGLATPPALLQGMRERRP
jgi:M6 family metalloprotease-like protein